MIFGFPLAVILLLVSVVYKSVIRTLIFALDTRYGKIVKQKRILGEVARDLGMGSFINATYVTDKNIITYFLLLLSIYAIIAGIVAKEENNV